MNEEQIIDVWDLFKEYLDKKHTDIVAEKFVDLLADYGVSDETLTSVLGNDAMLDAAINYYLDIDADIYDEEEDWDE
jgi:hypothetical protein